MKKLLSLALAGTMIFGLTGCGSKQEGVSSSKSEKILIYSNSASSGRGDWLTDKAQEAGFDIEVVEVAGGDLTNRLIAEKNNSLADLVFGLNTLEYEKLKAHDLLLQYEPAWADEVDATLGDVDGYYHPIVIQPLVLVMNPEYDNKPSDWIDLTDESYHKQFVRFGLGGSTGKTIFASIVSRYPDPNGVYGISDEGWEVAKAFVQNSYLEQSEDYISYVMDGSIPMSMLWGSGVIQNENERDFKFDVMVPEIGAPYVTEQIAIISKTDKDEVCKEFVDWFGSADIQLEWSNEFGSIPAQPEALANASDDVIAFMERAPKPQEMDWNFITENLDKWIEKVELEFVQ